MNFTVNTDTLTNLLAIAPAGLLVALIVVVILLDVIWPESRRREIGLVAGLGLFLIALASVLIQPPSDPAQQFVFGGVYRFDVMTQLFVTITLVAAGIAVLISLDAKGIGKRGEYYTVLLVATLGAVIMSGGADLIVIFLGLETLSISLYCLAGFLRNSERSAEAGLKYFLFGSFTSAIMLYGMSLLYGLTGYTNIYVIGQRVVENYAATSGSVEFMIPIILSMLMIAVGFGFKVSAVPFHFWTPDVYEGAPTPVTAYISVASKAASFAVLARVFLAVFQNPQVEPLTIVTVQLVAIIAAVTMTLGNLLALVQKNIKRLLAYSSIAQAGYALIGVAAIAANPGALVGAGTAAIGFYMAMYVLTNLAGFGVIILFANATGSEEIKDFAGLGRRNFGLAMVMTIALLSLAGIPPAAGFVGKFFLFRAAVDANLTWLAIVGVLNSIVALYYYLVVIKVMFVDRSEDESKPIPVSMPYVVALGISTIAVILIGTVLADPLFRWAITAAQGLFS
ncbi:MAG: NADH-quinone oxidoreductase subunit N [Anaerolineae bacterium]|nr:NADH-quinone oxidoreductase subunit N [Anaerolineae bacterium]